MACFSRYPNEIFKETNYQNNKKKEKQIFTFGIIMGTAVGLVNSLIKHSH